MYGISNRELGQFLAKYTIVAVSEFRRYYYLHCKINQSRYSKLSERTWHKKVHPKLPPPERSRGAARCRRPRSCCCGRPPMKTKTIRPTTTAISSRCTTSLTHSLDQSPTPTFATSSLMQISSSSPKSGLHTVDRTTQCLKSPDSRWLSVGTHGSSPLPIASHIVDSASLSVISLARRTARIIQIRSRCSEKVLLRLRLDRPPPRLRLPPPHTSKRRC